MGMHACVCEGGVRATRMAPDMPDRLPQWQCTYHALALYLPCVDLRYEVCGVLALHVEHMPSTRNAGQWSMAVECGAEIEQPQ